MYFFAHLQSDQKQFQRLRVCIPVLQMVKNLPDCFHKLLLVLRKIIRVFIAAATCLQKKRQSKFLIYIPFPLTAARHPLKRLPLDTPGSCIGNKFDIIHPADILEMFQPRDIHQNVDQTILKNTISFFVSFSSIANPLPFTVLRILLSIFYVSNRPILYSV